MSLEGLAKWVVLGGVSGVLFWLADLRRRSEGEPSVLVAAAVAFLVALAAHVVLALTTDMRSVLALALVSFPAVWLPCFIVNLIARFIWLRQAARSSGAV